MDDAPQMPIRLPVWKTVGSCYRALWNRQVAQMPFIWVIVALGVIQAWLAYNILPVESVGTVPKATLKHDLGTALLEMILSFAYILTFASLSVSWTRYVVRGERPTGWYFGSAMWKYFIMTTLILFVLVLPSGIVLSVSLLPHIVEATGKPGSNPLNSLGTAECFQIGGICLVLTLPLLWWFAHYYIKLGAIAVDDASITWKSSGTLIKGSILRVLACGILIMIGVSITNEIIEKIFSHLGFVSMISTILQSVITSGIAIYQTIALATLMGITYRTLVGTHLHLQHPSETPAES